MENGTDQAVRQALQDATTDPHRTIDQLLRIIANQNKPGTTLAGPDTCRDQSKPAT
jgi:hypothetical protein